MIGLDWLILDDFEHGRPHRTADGFTASLERGAYSGRLIVRVKPPAGYQSIGRADSPSQAAIVAAKWISEERLGCPA